MIEGDISELSLRDVAHVLQRGGTFLKSARSDRFRTPEGRRAAFEQIRKQDIDALIAIGGDGTFAGAKVFEEEFRVPIVGLPGTIDNDLIGTDATIGFDTAVNTVTEAVDKIRDTATSHNRLFFVEVMGRDSGFIALKSGIAVGAVAILIPETITTIDQLVTILDSAKGRGRKSSIVIVAEGDELGGAARVAELVSEKRPDYEARVTILGHLQRGGAPSASDRVLASSLGIAGVNAILDGQSGVMAGSINGETAFTPMAECIGKKSELTSHELEVANILSA
jgi:6-phosphofructokinase 1